MAHTDSLRIFVNLPRSFVTAVTPGLSVEPAAYYSRERADRSLGSTARRHSRSRQCGSKSPSSEELRNHRRGYGWLERKGATSDAVGRLARRSGDPNRCARACSM